ncbi:hypothetical protein GcM3_110011 [Golovinomyces cichoracearum]|uniref:Uncharacterized protein n=1 Tax=Golovinomyces cichoracearum TaxID=62708 RepID=A0A420I945_9PEZI|nr:hypothetical protein GcM3_110011 [Golovinomyces cichoracearum]
MVEGDVPRGNSEDEPVDVRISNRRVEISHFPIQIYKLLPNLLSSLAYNFPNARVKDENRTTSARDGDIVPNAQIRFARPIDRSHVPTTL